MPGTRLGMTDRDAIVMRKAIAIAILVPLAILIVMFAVANREIITVSFDPFDSAHPALAFKMPLFMLIFALVTVGVVVGGIAAWLRQGKHRRVARMHHSHVAALRREIDSLNTKLGDTTDAFSPEGGRIYNTSFA